MKRRWGFALWAFVTYGLLFSGWLEETPAVLWPSLAAVGLAFLTREIYSSLFLGALAGAILLRGGNLFEATFFGWIDLLSKHMLGSLSSRWNISILAFTLMMGGLVELLNQNGGMRALAALMLGSGDRDSTSVRRAGLSVFAMGWLVFFDGLANSMLVGKTMRATADRAGLSREKLSFIVDSTSSPIASVALISTWIVTEMSLIQEGLANLTNETRQVSPYGLLLESLPYRFYAYFLLVMVFLTIWIQRDIGPMVDAERRARGRSRNTLTPIDPANSPSGSVWLAILPILVLILGVFAGLFVQGGGLDQPWSLRNTIDALGRAEADIVFVCACATAVVTAIVLSFVIRSRQPEQSSSKETPEEIPDDIQVFFDGMSQMFLPALILVFAWTLNAVIGELGTATYLVQAVEGHFPAMLLPAAVFMIAAVISFSTGTSWGTMAIVIPLVIPLAAELGGSGTSSPILPASIGAVLAGSVFGDHCSPISDTTIVSAFASDCDAMDHVRTQIPYAISVAAIAILFGYLPAALGAPAWILLPAGAVACWALLRLVGHTES